MSGLGRPGPELDDAARERYRRHLVLPQVGEAGQRQLAGARVLVVGVGGLGSPLVLYLAAAGVGTLGIADGDRVERSNLQRQVLYGEDDVGRSKVAVAAERLRRLDPRIRVESHDLRVERGNVLELVAGYDVVVDGSDNAPTRFLLNDACVRAGLPLVWGAVDRFEGQLAVFWAARGPCYRCLFPAPPPPGSVASCAEAGVLGAVPGAIGALQASEVLKLVLGIGEPAIGRLLVFDLLRARIRALRLSKDPACPACSAAVLARPVAERPLGLEDAAPVCDAEAGAPGELPLAIDVAELDRWRREGRDLLLLDVREPEEHERCRLEGALLVPLRSLPQHLDALDRHRPLVVYCHLGGRSAQAVAYLRREGFALATNLAGGIDAWSTEIDPSVPRY